MNDIRVWNPEASGAAIEAEPEGHSSDCDGPGDFVEPATGALRVATGSRDKTIRVWDAETGGALLVIDVGSPVRALAFFLDPATGVPRLACGCDEGVRLRSGRGRRGAARDRRRLAGVCAGVLHGPGDGRAGLFVEHR